MKIILREHGVPFIFLTSSEDEQVMRSAVKVGAHLSAPANFARTLRLMAGAELATEGFQPGQELYLLIIDANGVQSDIEYALKPIPKANAAGAWSTTWSCGRYVKKKLVKEGTFAITAVNTKYEPLASTEVTFYKK